MTSIISVKDHRYYICRYNPQFMSNTIAAYYAGELLALDEATSFYTDEILELEAKLTDLLHRDSIPQLAENAEHFLDLLSKQQQQFLLLQQQIQQQQNKLKQDHGLIEDKDFNPKTKLGQDSLRRSMFSCEKEYLEIKYNCLDFLSGIISH